MALHTTINIQLRSFGIGPWKFNNLSTYEGCSSLVMEYQYPSEIVTVKVLSRDLAAVAGSFSLCGISAQLMSLANETPGYMMSMHVKLLLEVKRIQYVDFNLQSAVKNSSSTRNTTEADKHSSDGSPSDAIERKLRCHLATITADPMEAANLRDIVQLCVEEDQQLGVTGSVQEDAAACAKPAPLVTITEETDGVNSEVQKRGPHRGVSVFDSCIPSAAPEQTQEGRNTCLVPTLPFWAPYIPWWMYSRLLRRTLEMTVLLYLVFSMIWALWQLHRHFYIIQAVIAPIIAILKRYMAPILRLMDQYLASFTAIWVQLINPVYILVGPLFAPALRILGPLFAPAVHVLRLLWTTLKPLMHSQLVKMVIVPVFTFLVKPLTLVWSLLAKTRISLTALDEVKMRLSIVLNLVVGSVKSIWTGLVRFLHYFQAAKKRKKAMETIHPGSTPRAHLDLRRRLSRTPNN